MAQFFYGGNVAYDEGTSIRNLADTLLRNRQVAAASKQAQAAADSSVTKSLAELTALMADPTFQAVAAQNPQLAKAAVDESLKISGLSQGPIADLWAKFTGKETNAERLQQGMQNFFNSISMEAQNAIALDQAAQNYYYPPSERGQPAASQQPTEAPATPATPAAAATPQQLLTRTAAAPNQGLPPNISEPAPITNQPVSPQSSDVSEADKLGSELLQYSQERKSLEQNASSQGNPAVNPVAQSNTSSPPAVSDVDGRIAIGNALPTTPATTQIFESYRTSEPTVNTAAGTVNTTSVDKPTSPTPPVKATPVEAKDTIIKLVDSQTLQTTPLLPRTMWEDYAKWYAAKKKDNPSGYIRDPAKQADLATNNISLVSEYLADKGLSSNHIEQLIKATVNDYRNPVPAQPETPTTPSNQEPVIPQQQSFGVLKSNQNTQPTTPIKAQLGDKRLEQQVQVSQQKLDATLNSPAAKQVINKAYEDGSVDLKDAKTKAVVKKVSYLAVPAIVQHIRNLPPEELQQRWENAMTVARNMSLEGAVASNRTGLANAKVARLNSDTQLQIAQMQYYGDLARLAAAEAASRGSAQADSLKQTADMITSMTNSATETIKFIQDAAKNEGGLTNYLRNHPEMNETLQSTRAMLLSAQEASKKLLEQTLGISAQAMRVEAEPKAFLLFGGKKMIATDSAVDQGFKYSPSVETTYNSILSGNSQ